MALLALHPIKLVKNLTKVDFIDIKLFFKNHRKVLVNTTFFFFLLDVHFENLTVKLYVFYVLNTYQISFTLDIIYYSINKLIFYT